MTEEQLDILHAVAFDLFKRIIRSTATGLLDLRGYISNDELTSDIGDMKWTLSNAYFVAMLHHSGRVRESQDKSEV